MAPSSPMAGFEIGPIRPPSEAWSLLVRVTRNCPWNRCAFCPVYRGARFSIRPADEVKADIDAMAEVARLLRETSERAGADGEMTSTTFRMAARSPQLPPGAGQVASFLAFGGRHVFLQDANSLAMRPEQLVEVLRHLKARFPSVERVTSYARAHTLTRRKPRQLAELRQAGLTRVHVGLESGSDAVLALVNKGVDGARHVDAGRRAKAAGMELSEYLMPGLGGRELWREHALDSARVLSAINPDFIRLRTTAVMPGGDLDSLVAQGKMEPMDDEEVVEEIRLLVEHLECEGTTLASDHVLNLLPEVEGRLPRDKPAILELIRRFQSLPERERKAFILGKRAGQLNMLSDWENNREARTRALDLLDRVQERYGDDITGAVRDLMTRFV